MNHEDELEKIESESVEALRERLNTLNRCWSDTTCDCFQQKIADRLLEHYDAVVARMRTLEAVIRGEQGIILEDGYTLNVAALQARLAEALWLVENGTPHDRMISAGRWDEWLNRRNAILGWADDSGRTADSAADREDV